MTTTPVLAPDVAVLFDRVPVLGPGTPNRAVQSRLSGLTASHLFGEAGVDPNAEAVRAILAGLWLLHDFLDESHAISQELPSATGSYWHGIMHRREPDASNAKYWFRRVGTHPVFAPLHAEARTALPDAPAEVAEWLSRSTWDPFRFVDLCERHRDTGSAEEAVLCRIQKLEFTALFRECFSQGLRADRP